MMQSWEVGKGWTGEVFVRQQILVRLFMSL